MIELDKSPYNLTVQQIQKIQRLIASMSNEAKIGQLFS